MPGGFTGNGSVKWFVDANKVKGKPTDEDKGGGKHHQDGVDDTPQGGRFKITIQYPKDNIERNAFRQALYDAWSASSAPAVMAVTFSIPIEDNQSNVGITHGGMGPDNQIYVDWPK